MVLLLPEARKATYDYVVGSFIDANRISSEPELAAIGDGELLKLIIENLPEIIALILKLLTMFETE